MNHSNIHKFSQIIVGHMEDFSYCGKIMMKKAVVLRENN